LTLLEKIKMWFEENCQQDNIRLTCQFYVILIIDMYIWSLGNVNMRYTYQLNLPLPPSHKTKKRTKRNEMF